MSVLLLFPRLDLPFKGPYKVPEERGPIPEIRVHWKNLKDSFVKFCSENAIQFSVDEKCLWQFNPQDYVNSSYDTILVPHHEYHSFAIPGKRVLYYMQTPIENYFSIDVKGWGGNLSKHAISSCTYSKPLNFEKLQKRIYDNVSKFGKQIDDVIDDKDYVLFICQLPHDKTIEWHSSISVLDSLKKTVESCRKYSKKLLVKGHPLNKQSQEDLRVLCLENNVRWVEDASIHEAISKSTKVVTVNSGAGIDAILHQKRIFTFGHSEYGDLAYRGNIDNFITEDYLIPQYDIRCINFIESYINLLYDSGNYNSFIKLKEIY